jgi:hypothetical protein
MITGKKYIEIAVSSGCIVTGKPAVPHHVKCFNNGAGRVSDFLVIPLCPELHTDSNDAYHQDRSMFEMKYGREIELLAKTIQRVADKIARDK